ncbi:hypothetical protein Sgleb_00270 [Streptomyces glebosus]|uniref:Uncharacterized protein n=1 Tax=Streptomyces glebosus TaxID=249580 RepID=A0A640SLW8_9ACTN|nr:hypothetical protein Sgleb_00270 [Streptomyces glebosus]GHG74485.1 hypothetical protein GCM10010513_48570 [Streptomyces glebosus]
MIKKSRNIAGRGVFGERPQMTVPTHENGSLTALPTEVPDFPCNPHGYPRQWMQDTLVSAFHPEEARPVPSTKGRV